MLQFKIGITLIPGVGSVLAKTLIAHCGSPEAVFKEKKSALEKIPHVSHSIAKSIVGQTILQRAEEELEFIAQNKIHSIYYLDENYPTNLGYCMDSPVLLFIKGDIPFPKKKTISIVGTRMITPSGTAICEQIIADLAHLDIVITSGLAYGVDICAHRAALTHGIPTYGVVAHGLDTIYPTRHKQTAEKMSAHHGGVISEFISNTPSVSTHFPRRNRIIAGISDCTLVIESSIKGGSLITADMANSYSREVFAVPGKPNEEFSQGCNALIKQHKAVLVESAQDIIAQMGWDDPFLAKQKIQKELFLSLTPEQEKLMILLKENSPASIDLLCIQSGFTMNTVASTLLQLEFEGAVTSLPGKLFALSAHL